MTKISEALDQYTGICKEAMMTSAAKLSKSFEKVIIEILLLYMVIPGRIIQYIIRIVKRGQGHDEGKANGVFHVQLQVADDQYVPDETNF